MGQRGRAELLGVGGAAEHLPDGLGDGVAVDAVDLQQLLRFAAAGDVGHRQSVHAVARLARHRRAHRLTRSAVSRTVRGGASRGGGEGRENPELKPMREGFKLNSWVLFCQLLESVSTTLRMFGSPKTKKSDWLLL